MTQCASRRRAAPRLALLGALAVICASLVSVTGASSAGASDARVAIGAGAPLGRDAHQVAVPSTTSFTVVLTPGHAAELSQLVAAVSTPGSSRFRHFLRPGEFARQFAPPASARDAVTTYFSHYGLRVAARPGDALALRVTGPSGAVARALAARLAAVRTPGGTVVTQVAGVATLPLSVARVISGVAGLSTWHSPQGRALPAASPRVTLPATCTSAKSYAANNAGSMTVPEQAAAYGLNHQWAAGINGAGEKIAVYELTNYFTSDLTSYFKCYGLSPSMTQVKVDGGPGGGDTSPPTREEAALDIEEAGVLAPGAALLIYMGPNNTNGPVDVYQTIADQDTASVVTTSWGECELAPGDMSPYASEAPFFQQMAVQGQTVLAASGDSGSSDCSVFNNPNGTTDWQLTVDDPASQPDVTGVGGLTVTSIASSTTTLSESVWNNLFGSGGGGASNVWSQPAWQTGDGVPTNGARDVPDLSVMGDPDTGFIDFANGHWGGVGGTSIGAPLMSAVVATADQYCGGRLGLINPTLYSMASKSTGFDDVTSGNNAITSDPVVAGHYQAGAGYDMASGLGSPSPTTFIPALCTALPSIAASSMTLAPKGPIDLTGSTKLTVNVRNGDNAGIPNITPHVVAFEPGAAPIVTPIGQMTNALGSMSFVVSTHHPGVVTLDVSVGEFTLGSTQATFVSSAALAPRSLAPLAAPAPNIRVGGTSPTSLVAVGVSSTGHVLATAAAGSVVDLTSKLHLGPAEGAPALGCAGASCLALIDVGGRLVGLFNVNTPASATAVNYGTAYPAAANVESGSLSLDDHRNTGYFDAAYLNPARHVILAHYAVSSHTMGFVNLTAKDHLSLSAGATAVLSSGAAERYVVTRIGSTYWLVSDGQLNRVENVAMTTHYGAARATSLTGVPSLVRDAANGQLRLLGRTAGGATVIFSASHGSPNVLSSAAVVASAATSSAAVVPNTAVAGLIDVVVFVAAGTLRVASAPSWGAFAVPPPPTLLAPQVLSGPRPLVLAGGLYYALTP
jgi:hypothetical protein